MSNSAPTPASAPQSPPSPPNQTSPPTGAQSSPTASSPPPQRSPPPTQGQSSPPPTSKATPPSNSPPPTSPPPSSSPPSPPPSQSSGSSSPPPPPPAVSSILPPPSGSGSSKSPPPPPPPNSPPQVPPPPPGPKSSASHPPPASPNYSPPPTSSPNSPAFSSPPPPPNTPPTGSLPTPAVPNAPPPPVAGNSGSPPAQTTSPPSAQSPPNAVPSPQAPGSPYQSSTHNPTPPNVPPSTSTPPALQTPNRVPSPPSSSTLSQSSTSSKSSSTTSGHGPAIGIAVAGVMIIAFVTFFFVVRKRKKKQEVAFSAQYKSPPSNFSGQPDGYYYHSYQHSGGPSGQSGGNFTSSPSALGHSYGSNKGYSPHTPEANVMGAQSWFSYEELMEITNGFSRQNILGEGGFGCVYKGWLPDGRVVAVKQLKAGSGQGEREFRAEVEIISRVHHRHLVSLVGYCIADHHRLLVYEFVPNKTLEHHLHGKGLPVMEWSKRVKIALGSARGLAYLHEDCHPKIIHRDIKSANILLDDAFDAQVADFGLAKLTNDTNTHVSTRVMGTFGNQCMSFFWAVSISAELPSKEFTNQLLAIIEKGYELGRSPRYMAPEYATSGKLTDRSDVFSFGVVLLEIVTGRKSVDPTQPLGEESLAEWARPLLHQALETGNLEEIADPRLERRYVESEMFRLIETAAACVRHSSQKRPRMSQVVRALDTESEMTDLSNGVKYGQSTIFESGQNADLQRFRRMAFGSSDDSSDYSIYSGENNSREVPLKTQSSWSQNGSTEFSIVGRGRP